jgi:hypothetical protein
MPKGGKKAAAKKVTRAMGRARGGTSDSSTLITPFFEGC